MVQREVGERLAAGPGDRAYGIPRSSVAWWADARVVGTVPATVFVPRPKVDSVLVEVVRRPAAGRRPRPPRFRPRRRRLRPAAQDAAQLAGGPRRRRGLRVGRCRPDGSGRGLDVADWLRLAEAVAGP